MRSSSWKSWSLLEQLPDLKDELEQESETEVDTEVYSQGKHRILIYTYNLDKKKYVNQN